MSGRAAKRRCANRICSAVHSSSASICQSRHFSWDVPQGRVHHLQFAIPENTRGFAINRDLIGKLSNEFIQIFRRPIVAQAFPMQFGGNSSRCPAPRGVVIKLGNPFHDMPMPASGKLLQCADVMFNEWLAVKNNREEVNGQVFGRALDAGLYVCLARFSRSLRCRLLRQRRRFGFFRGQGSEIWQCRRC